MAENVWRTKSITLYRGVKTLMDELSLAPCEVVGDRERLGFEVPDGQVNVAPV
jgi:hypothetical protein